MRTLAVLVACVLLSGGVVACGSDSSGSSDETKAVIESDTARVFEDNNDVALENVSCIPDPQFSGDKTHWLCYGTPQGGEQISLDVVVSGGKISVDPLP